MNYLSSALSVITISCLLISCEGEQHQQNTGNNASPKVMEDFLPSWNDTKTTTRIIDFVEMAANEDSIPKLSSFYQTFHIPFRFQVIVFMVNIYSK